MLRLTLAGPDTLLTSPLCAKCPSGPAGCCAAPPAVAWADIGRIVRHGGGDWLLAEIASGRLRPCPRGLAIARIQGPHGLACTYLGERGCELSPDRRSVTCNEYLCEDAFAAAERASDPSAAAARAAHARLEYALSQWDASVSAELAAGFRDAAPDTPSAERPPPAADSLPPGDTAPVPDSPPARGGASGRAMDYDVLLWGKLRRAFERAVTKAPLVLCLLFTVFLVACSGLSPSVPRGGAFDAKRLEGGWTVAASNFPMWLEGNKTDPNFIYRLRPGTSPVELDDIVAYTQSGRRDTIEGTDTQDPASPAHFTWRGDGLLAAFSSDWIVLRAGPDDRWLILYFTKTFATPEGVDVIVKKPPLSAEDRAEIQETLAADPFLKSRSAGLVWLAK